MPRFRAAYPPEFRRQVDALVSQGQTVAEAVRSIGVMQFTFHRWRQEYGGLKLDEVKRLKELVVENNRQIFYSFAKAKILTRIWRRFYTPQLLHAPLGDRLSALVS